MGNLVYEDRGHVKRYYNTDIISELSKIHGEKFLEYRRQWELGEKGEIVPEKPLHFFAEYTSHCNLKCKMCYHAVDSKERVVHNVSMDIVKKVAQQCKELEIPSIEIGSGAECTLHPEFETLLKTLKKAQGMDYILITNGTMLNEKMMNLILDLQIERLQISIDAATSETYKKIRGGDYEKLETNINRFIELKKERNSVLPILRLSFVKQKENIHEIEAFIQKWKDRVDIIDFQDFISHENVDNLKDIEIKDFVCPHPFHQLGMTHNGDLVPCCTFFAKHLVLGNIKDMTIEEAWNCDKIKALRESFFNGKINKVCKNCYGSLKFRG